MTNGAAVAGTPAVKGVYAYNVGGTLPTATSDNIVVMDNTGTPAVIATVPVTFLSATPSATEVATAIVGALNGNSTVNAKFVAVADGVRVTLTQKTASTTVTDVVTSVSLTTAAATTFTTHGTSVLL